MYSLIQSCSWVLWKDESQHITVHTMHVQAHASYIHTHIATVKNMYVHTYIWTMPLALSQPVSNRLRMKVPTEVAHTHAVVITCWSHDLECPTVQMVQERFKSLQCIHMTVT